MDIKQNDSTINRPFGKRPLDAPFIPVDLHAFTQQLMLEEAWQKNDRNAITVFKSEGVTVVLVAFHKDAEMIPGTYEGTGKMTLQVMDGRINFEAHDEQNEISRGQMAILHEHIPYKATALEETICLLTMIRDENNTNDNKVPSPLH